MKIRKIAQPSLCGARMICLTLALSASVFAAGDLSTQRESFRKVLDAQSTGGYMLARKLVIGLEDYPLYPYFRYFDLRRRLHHVPEPDVAQFLSAYDGSFLADRLRTEWLKQLGRLRRWEIYLQYYRPSEKTKLRCLQVVSRINRGMLEGVLADTKSLWLVGKSQPDECDPAFKRLYASDVMDDDLLWQRIRLAMENGKSSLARFVANKLQSEHRKRAFEFWSFAHRDPAWALRRDIDGDFADESREIMLYALKRLAHRNVDRALDAWDDISARVKFSADEIGVARNSIAIAAAVGKHDARIQLLDAVPAMHVDARVERYRLLAGIAEAAWESLSRWTAMEPVSDVNGLRWRYWRSRALEQVGRSDEALRILRELARERDYYGFLAADRLGQNYQFNFDPVTASAGELSEVLAISGIMRARELFLLDIRVRARREWMFEISKLSRRQQEITALLASQWGWHDRAIFALGRAKSYDDLRLRFPVLYADEAIEYAEHRRIAPARVLAIIRSESAFIANARSAAGALGLMQIMPSTARETAKSIGMRFDSAKILNQPRHNIAIGTAYLKQMLGRYNGNFAMAAAAYSAGPYRVQRWRPPGGCEATDRWIDTIPFTETRRYVRRVFFYTAVYEWRLEQDITRLQAAMSPIPGRQPAKTTACLL